MQDYQSVSEKLFFSLRCEKWYYIKNMIYFALLFLEIFLLFFLSRKVSRELSKFLSINLLSFLFLPGVIIHELSHLLIAAILLVPVGHMEFKPKKSQNGVKLGSVEIGKTDPIRRSIIGFAPVFVGFAIIVGIVYFFFNNIVFFQDKNSYLFLAAILGIIYLLFAISNTMFSSSKDMEGTVEILITLLIVFTAAYILGFRPSFDFAQNLLTKEILETVRKSTIFLLAPITIDVVILSIIKVIYKRR